MAQSYTIYEPDFYSDDDSNEELEAVPLDQILWSGVFLDGKLFFVKTSTPLHIHWYLESTDCYASGCIDIPRNMTLTELIDSSVEQIKTMYTTHIMNKKNEDLMHGDINIH